MKGRELGLVSTAPPKRLAVDRHHRTEETPQNDTVLDWSALMALAQQGNGIAYRQLLSEITPYLRNLAAARLNGSAEVEDAVQDVLLTIHKLRHTYDPARPLGPWLVTIAKRRIIDRFRQTARRGAMETVLKPTHETFPADRANRCEESVDRYVLRKAVDDLPPSQREAILLLKLEEMSLKEASAVSGMSVSALKVATHRALKSLRRIIVDEND